MGLLARRSRVASKQNLPITPQTSGYIGEFLKYVLAPLLPKLLVNKTRVITNAGGLDPVGLKQLIEKHLEKNGIHDVKVAAVSGDDLLPTKSELFRQDAFKSFEPLNGAGKPEPMLTEQDNLLSLNAYIGAQPIVHALNSGAQIIVTGRVVDSALVLAPLAYSYNWDLSPTSPDLHSVASASLAGHIIECGAQCTGGNFTDWRDGAFSGFGGWSNMGYPIVEFNPDGTFIVTKPVRTGGIVSKLSVAEQMLYEVLDPANYLLPDVNLDLSHVTLKEVGKDRVRVSGAKGRPPTPWLKCTAIKQDGYRIEGALIIPGFEAREKARILGEALIQRANGILKGLKMSNITEYRIETPGAEEMFGYSVLRLCLL
jgi:Acyclic terpene utilisation family protein AtuA